LIGSQIYRKWDVPYYKTGNTVCISILALGIVTFIVQRQWLVYLNKKKIAVWDSMSTEQKLEYQTDVAAREAEGNKRLDFRFAY
jgi:hypothetical protein